MNNLRKNFKSINLKKIYKNKIHVYYHFNHKDLMDNKVYLNNIKNKNFIL